MFNWLDSNTISGSTSKLFTPESMASGHGTMRSSCWPPPRCETCGACSARRSPQQRSRLLISRRGPSGGPQHNECPLFADARPRSPHRTAATSAPFRSLNQLHVLVVAAPGGNAKIPVKCDGHGPRHGGSEAYRETGGHARSEGRPIAAFADPHLRAERDKALSATEAQSATTAWRHGRPQPPRLWTGRTRGCQRYL